MRKFLLLLFVSLFCIPMQMRAAINRASDLDGMAVAIVYYGNDVQLLYSPKDNGGGYLTVSGNTVTLHNFQDNFDLPMTFDSSTKKLSISKQDNNLVGYDRTKLGLYTMNYYGVDTSGSYPEFAYTKGNNGITSQAISDDLGGGMYRFTFDSEFYMGIYKSNGTFVTGEMFGQMDIFVFPPNAKGESYKSNNSLDKEYKVELDIDDDDSFVITNFANLGIGFYHTNLYYNSNGEVQTNYEFRDLYGQINRQNMTVTIYATGYSGYYSYSGYWYKYNGQNMFWEGIPSYKVYQLALSGSSSSPFTDITGTLSYDNFKTINGPWLLSGLNASQKRDLKMIFANQFYYYNGAQGGADRTFNKQVITYTEDITHAVSLSAGSVSITKTGSSVSATISGVQNTDYVTSYDLYAVPGNITSISGQSLDNNCGIAGAVLVKSGISVANGTVTANFSPNNTFINNVKNASNNVTLFLKANYNVSGLTSTFHALKPVTATLNLKPNAPVVKFYPDGSDTPSTDYVFNNNYALDITAEEGCAIYYYLDEESSEYAQQFTEKIEGLDEPMTVHVYAQDAVGEKSDEVTVAIKKRPAKPTASFLREDLDNEFGNQKYFKFGKSITIKLEAEEGANIYYNERVGYLSGGYPSADLATTPYSKPLVKNTDLTYTVVAEKDGVRSEPLNFAITASPEFKFVVESDIPSQCGEYPKFSTVYFSTSCLVKMPRVSDRTTVYYAIDQGVDPSNRIEVQSDDEEIFINSSCYIQAYGHRDIWGGTTTIYFVKYEAEGLVYTPTNKVITCQESDVAKLGDETSGVTVENIGGRGYIIASAHDNTVHALSKEAHTEAGIASTKADYHIDGKIYYTAESQMREFYIGGNTVDGYYFWGTDGGEHKVLSTDPAQNNLYFETKADADRLGHVYLCKITIDNDVVSNPSLAPRSTRSRVAKIEGEATENDLYNATITFGSTNVLNMFANAEAPHVFAAGPSTSNPIPVHLFATDDFKTTGVESIVVGSAIITVEGNAVVIRGTDAPVIISNLAGMVVYEGTDRRIELSNGIYVVTVDNAVAKVAIK